MPVKVDSETGYRYYSILQYEKLSTIKELRQLGMSIDEIKKYFDNRNAAQSVDILRTKRDELQETILELKALEKSISGKIKDMDHILKVTDLNSIVFKELEARDIITFNRTINTPVELSYAGIELEMMLKEIAPIVASNRYGAIRKLNQEASNECGDLSVLFLVIRDKRNIDEKHIRTIGQGQYACMYYQGVLLGIDDKLKIMKDVIEGKGYKVVGEVLQIVQIDSSITDRSEEILIEIQIPIEKA